VTPRIGAFLFSAHTAPTDPHSLSLHDALPICAPTTAPVPAANSAAATSLAYHSDGAAVGVHGNAASIQLFNPQLPLPAVTADETAHEIICRMRHNFRRSALLSDDPAGLYNHHFIAP